jgi:hypothetical protein
MVLIEVLVDFVLGPITIIEVITNLNGLSTELGFLAETVARGQILSIPMMLFSGRLLLSKLLVGMIGTLAWGGVVWKMSKNFG